MKVPLHVLLVVCALAVGCRDECRDADAQMAWQGLRGVADQTVRDFELGFADKVASASGAGFHGLEGGRGGSTLSSLERTLVFKSKVEQRAESFAKGLCGALEERLVRERGSGVVEGSLKRYLLHDTKRGDMTVMHLRFDEVSGCERSVYISVSAPLESRVVSYRIAFCD